MYVSDVNHDIGLNHNYDVCCHNSYATLSFRVRRALATLLDWWTDIQLPATIMALRAHCNLRIPLESLTKPCNPLRRPCGHPSNLLALALPWAAKRATFDPAAAVRCTPRLQDLPAWGGPGPRSHDFYMAVSTLSVTTASTETLNGTIVPPSLSQKRHPTSYRLANTTSLYSFIALTK